MQMIVVFTVKFQQWTATKGSDQCYVLVFHLEHNPQPVLMQSDKIRKQNTAPDGKLCYERNAVVPCEGI